MNKREKLFYYINEISDVKLKNALEDMFINYELFFTSKGSRDKHHSHEGGLLDHTLEVTDIALSMAASSFIEVDRDILLAAALVHDIGKIFDYKIENRKQLPEYNFHGSHIRHLCRSYAEFQKFSEAYEVSNDIKERIEHCILAHHGRPDWGSPIEPKTIEAEILHYADMISYKYGKTKDGT